MTTSSIPTIEQVRAAISKPLCESYWWATGWNFNRPVIACLSIAVHVKDGPYVLVRFFDEEKRAAGYTVSELVDIPLQFSGPITLESASPDCARWTVQESDYNRLRGLLDQLIRDIETKCPLNMQDLLQSAVGEARRLK